MTNRWKRTLHSGRWIALAALLAAGLAAAVGAVGMYLGTTQVIYDRFTLAPGATRVDTVVVTGSPEDRRTPRPTQIVWAFACSTGASSDDSVQYAVVAALVGGRRLAVGDDSLALAPRAPESTGWVGETQIMHTVADSYEVRSVNPATTAAKAGCWWYPRSER